MNLIKLYKNLYKPQTPLTGKDYTQAVLTAIFIVVLGLVLWTYLLTVAGSYSGFIIPLLWHNLFSCFISALSIKEINFSIKINCSLKERYRSDNNNY